MFFLFATAVRYEEVPQEPVPRRGTGCCGTAFLNRSRDSTSTRGVSDFFFLIREIKKKSLEPVAVALKFHMTLAPQQPVPLSHNI